MKGEIKPAGDGARRIQQYQGTFSNRIVFHGHDVGARGIDVRGKKPLAFCDPFFLAGSHIKEYHIAVFGPGPAGMDTVSCVHEFSVSF